MTAGLLAVLPLGFGCLAETSAPPISVSAQKWSFGPIAGQEYITDHFDIYSTLADRELADALPEFLEAAYRQFAELLPPKVGGRMRSYMFGDRRQWDLFTRETFPKQYPVYRQISAGGYAAGDVCVAYYLRHRSYTLSVLAHEGMHQYFAHHFDTALPAWVNEGLACYCESFDLPGGVPRFTPRRNTFRINALREALSLEGLLPLSEMLSTDAGKVIVAGRSRKVKTYYAQAWAMIVFMRHGAEGQYRAGFDRMLADIAAGELPVVARAAKIRAPAPAKTSFGEAVFRAYISEDLDTFDRQFRAFLFELAGFRQPESKAT